MKLLYGLIIVLFFLLLLGVFYLLLLTNGLFPKPSLSLTQQNQQAINTSSLSKGYQKLKDYYLNYPHLVKYSWLTLAFEGKVDQIDNQNLTIASEKNTLSFPFSSFDPQIVYRNKTASGWQKITISQIKKGDNVTVTAEMNPFVGELNITSIAVQSLP